MRLTLDGREPPHTSLQHSTFAIYVSPCNTPAGLVQAEGAAPIVQRVPAAAVGAVARDPKPAQALPTQRRRTANLCKLASTTTVVITLARFKDASNDTCTHASRRTRSEVVPSSLRRVGSSTSVMPADPEGLHESPSMLWEGLTGPSSSSSEVVQKRSLELSGPQHAATMHVQACKAEAPWKKKLSFQRLAF